MSEIMQKYISIKGAKENNLKNINLEIPRNKITAVVGVSDSGKSSLIIDTLQKACGNKIPPLISEYENGFDWSDDVNNPSEILRGKCPACICSGDITQSIYNTVFERVLL